jgi:competence protein ComEC
MRLAGISHILCISGLHLSLIAIICFKFWRFTLNASNWLAHKVNIKIIAGIIAMLFSYCYLKLSGSQVSATRAFIMCSIASIAFIIQRDYNPLRAVGVSAFSLLLINPSYCLLPGFQLSFLSVLALIAGYKNNGLKSSTLPPFLAKIKNHLISNFYSSMLIGVSTAPIVIYHFFKVANYSPLANIIAVPITTFVLMPCAFAFFLVMPFGGEYYLLKFMAYFTDFISAIAGFIENLEYSTINIGTVDGINVCIYLLGFFWAIIWQSKMRYLAILPMLFACIRTYNDFKPDLALDVEKIILGFANKQQQLTIYSTNKLNQFTRQYWASWFGRSDWQYNLIAKNQNIDFVIACGKKIALVFNHEGCNTEADFIINYGQVPCLNDNTFNVRNTSKKFLLLKCNAAKCWSYD